MRGIFEGASIFDHEDVQDLLWNAGVSDEIVEISRSRDAKLLIAKDVVQAPRLPLEVRKLAVRMIVAYCQRGKASRGVINDVIAMFNNFARVSSQEVSARSLPLILSSLISVVFRRDGIFLSCSEITKAFQSMMPSSFKQNDEVLHNNIAGELNVLAALDWQIDGPFSILFWVELFCKRLSSAMGVLDNVTKAVLQFSVQAAERMMIEQPPCEEYPTWQVAVGIIAASMALNKIILPETERKPDASLTDGKDFEQLSFLARACCCSTSEVAESFFIFRAVSCAAARSGAGQV
jgi:hypothetical protein